jgi:hypothetical protein
VAQLYVTLGVHIGRTRHVDGIIQADQACGD